MEDVWAVNEIPCSCVQGTYVGETKKMVGGASGQPGPQEKGRQRGQQLWHMLIPIPPALSKKTRTSPLGVNC